jgi:hypothetical protein
MNNESDEKYEITRNGDTLREEVGKGFAQLDAGQRVPATDVYARMEARIQQIEDGA